MSSTNIDQSRVVSPVIVNTSLSSTISKKKHHHRSSVTTTTLSSTRRYPIASFRSMGSPSVQSQSSTSSSICFSSTSPLNDLRQQLASSEGIKSSIYLSRPIHAIHRREQYSESSTRPPRVASRHLATGPQSAPALLLAAPNRAPEMSTKSEPRLEITTEMKLCAPEKVDDSTSLTNDNDDNLDLNSNNHKNNLQVVEFDPTLALSSGEVSSEPIVEVKGTSSSSNSSAVNSPISSRQSSDCDDASAKRNRQQPPQERVAPNHCSGSSSSSSSCSSSSSRLIRRRTVRRSYHHRALEADREPQVINSLIVTTTTTSSSKPTTTSGGGSEQQVERSHAISSQPLLSSSLNEQRQQSSIPTRKFGDHLIVGQKKLHQLSTSTSSSKIATTHKKSSTSTSSTSSSSRQVIKNNEQVQHQSEHKHEESKSAKTSASSLTMKTADQQDLKRGSDYAQPASLFERRNRQPSVALLADIERADTTRGRSVEIEQEESSVHHRELSSFNATSSRVHSELAGAGTSTSAATAAAAMAASRSSSSLSRSATTKTLSSRDSASQQRQLFTKTADMSTSSSSSNHFKTSSLFLSSAAATAANAQKHQQQRSPFLTTPSGIEDSLIFSSPDVRSLVQEIGTDFAELENALSSTSFSAKQQQHLTSSSSSLSSRLFGTPQNALPRGRLQSPLSLQFDATAVLKNEPETLVDYDPTADKDFRRQLDQFDTDTHSTSTKYAQRQSDSASSGEKIRELLERAQRHRDDSSSLSNHNDTAHQTGANDSRMQIDGSLTDSTGLNTRLHENARCKAVMSESIGRIDQKMSDLCRKLECCDDTQKAIDLLKIMIQMIEKAWSVPVCGDDLGFKLCSSLYQFGGLDIVLGFIHEADEQSLLVNCDSTPGTATVKPDVQQPKQSKLRLNLSKIHCQQGSREATKEIREGDSATGDAKEQIPDADHASKSAPLGPSCPNAGDNNSEILTPDVGLELTSVESLSYVSATGAEPSTAVQTPPPSDESVNGSITGHEKTTKQDVHEPETKHRDGTQQNDGEELQHVRKEELVFLSAHLLSQCLTSENRDYIVNYGHLDPVIKLACNFTTMKSGHSKRLLKRSALMRRSSTLKQKQGIPDKESTKNIRDETCPETRAINDNMSDSVVEKRQDDCETNPQQEQRSDMHSAIGTEILQHLFKHSEETCSRAISLGALQAILYGCRSSHIETLRHCASALANLALYGGPDSQQMMIEQKAHVWLFPLAFNEDDNVQYYACLAIVVLAANQEIEADVQQSSTLDLVEPFVTSHEPRKFAESTTSHIHGQSAGWLKKLMPLLESKREEARNLACFHFAMEAYIKREQGQTELFREIGSVELLRRAGSSPIAIASKFACQALRLIGEKEPHKLSQQVPLWTCEDVCEWVSQIGFEKFKQNFRDSLVDGDLLLTLDEQSLKFDLGIENGIIRRRFMRELGNLKRIADYSSVDKSGLGQLLVNSMSIMNNSLKSTTGNQLVQAYPTPSSSSANRNARDFMQYIYPILQSGVTKDNIHLLDCEQLLADCKISNTLHRIKLAQSIREIQDRIIVDAASNEQNSLGGPDQKTLDVFVSYRRSTGSQLASLLKVHLQLRGFTVFIDVERLEAGKFDNNLLDSVKTARNFILVLSPNALDRCIDDHECKDWVHKEIVAALASNCNIIPIIDNFHWPDPEQLPEDMRSITYFNGIRWIHDYQDACVDKVERFIRGELSNSGCGGSQTTGAASIISSVSGSGGTANPPTSGFQRLPSQSVTNVSTPSIIATTPSLLPNSHINFQQHINNAKIHPSQASEYPSPYPTDNNHHPLSSTYSPNLYMQHNLRLGNSNNNVRLQ